MNEFLPFILKIMLIVAPIFLVMFIKQMYDEIYELKGELEKHIAMLNHLEFDYSSISDIEERLDQLEEALELKEYYDDASRNKK